jgi:hypothetical protein
MQSLPKMVALPLVGWIKASNVLMVVDFPAPLGPIKPKISPSLTLKLTSMIPWLCRSIW